MDSNTSAREELYGSIIILGQPRMKTQGTSFFVSIGVFIYATVLYGLTVAPTASFWDAGEFIAIAHGLQVSHPPGAPFYMLVGRFFSMFVPAHLVSLSVNIVSVLCSSF